jgi:hypothetical protein
MMGEMGEMGRIGEMGEMFVVTTSVVSPPLIHHPSTHQ